jgi:hypothetical protein
MLRTTTHQTYHGMMRIALAATTAAFLWFGVSDVPAADPVSAPDTENVVVEKEFSPAAARIAALLNDPQIRGIVSIDHVGAAPAAPPQFLILLTDGSRFPAESVQLENDVLKLRLATVPEPESPTIDVELVRGIVFPGGQTSARREWLKRLLEDQHFRDDVVILEGNDRLSGEVRGIIDEGLQIESPAGPVTLATTRVQGVAFSRDLWRVPEPTRPRIVLSTHDGAILTASAGEVHNGFLDAQLNEDVMLPVPLPVVRRLALYGDDVVPLSSLSPIEVRAVPYLPGGSFAADSPDAKQQPATPGSKKSDASLQINRSFRGTPLTLDSVVHPLGLGVASGVSLVYEIPEKSVRFLATVGLDDAVGDEGAVIYRILLDDREAWASAELTGGDKAVAVEVDVLDAAKITLQVDFASDGDIQDVADWCDPVFQLEAP